VAAPEPVEPAPPPAEAADLFRKNCYGCHGKAATGGLNLQKLVAEGDFGGPFTYWERVATALEEHQMPPAKMPQPKEEHRNLAARWIRERLNAYAAAHSGDPGAVTVRRLTSGEYNYTLQDLTGLDLDFAADFEGDSVGGEGFASYGDVQFVGDASLERYLEAAKRVASHAVIGAGPLEFYKHSGKSGWELSAVDRIQGIYQKYGFRTVSGEGGTPFGLDRYGKAFYVAWRYRHRAALGQPGATLTKLAGREGIAPRFASHVWTVLNRADLAYPASEVAARWRKLPGPGTADPEVRRACTEVQKYSTTWPSWLFARGDVAAGGAGDERPLEFSDNSLAVRRIQPLRFLTGRRLMPGVPQAQAAAPKSVKVYLNATPVNPLAKGEPVIVWRNARLAYRFRVPGQVEPGLKTGMERPVERYSIRSFVTEESARKLAFGYGVEGLAVGPNDFVSLGSVSFEVPLPAGALGVDLEVDAELGSGRDHVVRLNVSDRADGMTRGVPVWALLGDPESAGYRNWREGVKQFARLLPPNSHSEPTPADKDPIPAPWDKVEYNHPERDAFILKVKYLRDDRFVVENMLDDAARVRLEEAWNDLFASFDYHQMYLLLLADWYKVDEKGLTLETAASRMSAFPAEGRAHVRALLSHYEKVRQVQLASQPRHVQQVLEFASRAWRRPLTEGEKAGLRAFYGRMRTKQSLDHTAAVRALITRVLVSPDFLYRSEQSGPPRSDVRPTKMQPVQWTAPAAKANAKPLTDWELATRLSYFLWSSIPDAELSEAARLGKLRESPELRKQVKRMLADSKARRMATEFFGQWLGFYRFDQFRGVDTARFPEFTDEVKASMYDEAVSFFEHIIRKDRPVREMLDGDYTFVNETLAKYYGMKREVKGGTQRIEGAGQEHRGGMLRLGSVLTVTSAPLRTSPVKRGDWLLRRVLGTPVPPPPADAGSLPADPKAFGTMTVKQRLEAHKRNATCAGCHTKIDPLGFPLEKFDSTGRWRESYGDGKAIEDDSTLANRDVRGVEGLLAYLKSKEPQVLKTFTRKLIGYALGRTVLLSDQPLIEELTARGGDTAFSDLVAGIVMSPQFQQRRLPEGPASEPDKTMERRQVARLEGRQ
jgi:mono/diheme cytochrome c family protein